VTQSSGPPASDSSPEAKESSPRRDNFLLISRHAESRKRLRYTLSPPIIKPLSPL
jgi:hypothetical protein